jgi:hypothetical protein
MEIWRSITGTKGLIEVSNKGRVRSLLSGTPRVLKTQVDNKGYHRIRVTIEQEKMSYKVHREVAKVFIANPASLPQVNHKDGNKDNNSVDNLEWVTNRDNARHAIENGLWDSVLEGSRRENERRKRPVIGYPIDGYCKYRRYESVAEAERFVGSRHVCDVLKGKRNSVKGWIFRYEVVMPDADIDNRSA